MSDPTSVVHSDPDVLGGTPVFVGTRVPLQSLIDYLAAGDSLDEFLHQFPSVRREQAQAALTLAGEALGRRVSVAA
jgi:uncharacterized protein (DUF433 family)